MKSVRGLIVLLTSFLIGFGTVAIAWGGVDQSGRVSNASTVDGTQGYVRGDGFSAPQNTCVLYSLLTADLTANVHIESGVVRCNNITIDGTCPSGRGFVERHSPTGDYYCVPGDAFSNGSPYFTRSQRTSTTSTTVTGSILNASNSQGSFGLSDTVRAYAWGEVTSPQASQCPPSGSAEGHFFDWQRLNGSTWSTVTGSDVYHYANGISGAPCMTVTATNPTGDFYVHN